MMMSKPAPEKTEEEAPLAFATKPEEPKKKSPQSAVEDLERRLALLGNADATPEVASGENDVKQPAVPVPAPSVTPAAPPAADPAAMKGGKNALLARIMAAQERTRQAQTKAEPPKQEADLLMTFDAPATENNPPPAFDVSLLPPPDMPPPTMAEMAPPSMPPPTMTDMPPSFDMVEKAAGQQMNFTPPPPIDAVAPPPMPVSAAPQLMAPSAPTYAPSAPSFEDLVHSQMPAPAHQNPLAGMQVVPPPVAPPAIDEDVLGALDPAERAALLEEQRQIMEQIEKEKASNQASSAAARALAFDQRSAPAVARAAAAMDRPAERPRSSQSRKSNRQTGATGAPRTVDLGSGEQVPLHGSESTQQAIKDGTAVLIQCVNCQNWMQVTEDATLMFCPVCQVVSPVDKNSATLSQEEVAQMDADQKLAEQLQQEEYKQAAGDGGEGRTRSRPRAQPKQETSEEGQSWYDWLVGNPVKPTQTATRSSPRQLSPPRSSGGLVSAQTGEESNPYAFQQRSTPGGARVAEQKSMFACVADSIGTAATAMTAHNLTEDPEGNVHGVDSASLLAMPQVSRQRD